MSNTWTIPVTHTAATAIPFGLLGGFGPTGDHSILPWLGFVAGWAAWMLIARWGISQGWWQVAHEDSSSMSAYLAVSVKPMVPSRPRSAPNRRFLRHADAIAG